MHVQIPGTGAYLQGYRNPLLVHATLFVLYGLDKSGEEKNKTAGCTPFLFILPRLSTGMWQYSNITRRGISYLSRLPRTSPSTLPRGKGPRSERFATIKDS